MNRITIKNLETLAETINRETGSPSTALTDGKWNPGHFHIDQGYGGCRLVQTVNSDGGIRTITDGLVSKPVLYELMHIWLAGYRAGKVTA